MAVSQCVTQPGSGGGRRAGVTGMRNLETILAPTDFSDTAATALTYATALADAYGATLHLLHVVESPAFGRGGPVLWGYSLPSLIEGLTQSAETRLSRLGRDAEPRVTIVRRTRSGQPLAEIQRYAREHDIGLIVIGTHGRGAVEHLLLGSVAAQVVRASPCPVLTVRQPERRFVMP